MKTRWLYILILAIFAHVAPRAAAQSSIPITVQVGKAAYEGDSIPHITMPTLHKHPPLQFRSKSAQKKYNRMVFNVKRTLPIAKLVRTTIIETYELLQMLPESERAAHLKRVEKGLLKQYGPQIKKLTISQGKMLVKLIDRECNNTGYAITKAFIGATRANFYQAIALCFGNSLAKHYDPKGEDKELERIVRLVESGQL